MIFGQLFHIIQTNFLPLFYIVPIADYTTAKIPDFAGDTEIFSVLLMFLEFLMLLFCMKQNSYRLAAFSSSISGYVFTDILQSIFVDYFETNLDYWSYRKVFAFKISEYPENHIIAFFFAFLLCDLSYYFFHRMFHEVSLFWSAHAVHHIPTDMNLSSAAHQPILVDLFSFPFWLAGALLGIPRRIYFMHITLNNLSQFWIHTSVIEKCHPLIEYIFNTPSHHRVHHSINKYAIDSNYGGVLMLWDRIFGTFVDEKSETEEIRAYGIVHPFNSFNPITIQFKLFIELLVKAVYTRSWIDRFKVLFYGPGYNPNKPDLRLGDRDDIPDPKVDFKTRLAIKYDPEINIVQKIYVFLQTVFLLMIFFDGISINSNILSNAFMIGLIFTVGSLLDGYSTIGNIAEIFRILIVTVASRVFDLGDCMIFDFYVLLSLIGMTLVVCGSVSLKPKILKMD